MSELLIELSQKALTLCAEERERLAEDLLISLQEEVNPEAQAAWDQELRRRVMEVESGVAKLVPAVDVFAQARRVLGR